MAMEKFHFTFEDSDTSVSLPRMYQLKSKDFLALVSAGSADDSPKEQLLFVGNVVKILNPYIEETDLDEESFHDVNALIIAYFAVAPKA